MNTPVSSIYNTGGRETEVVSDEKFTTMSEKEKHEMHSKWILYG